MKIKPHQNVLPLCILATALFSPVSSHAQVVFESGTAIYNALSDTFFEGADCRDPQSDSVDIVFPGFDFLESRQTACASGPYTASATTELDVQVEAITNGIMVDTRGEANAAHSLPENFQPPGSTRSNAGVTATVSFELLSEGTLSVTGMLTASGSADSPGTAQAVFRLDRNSEPVEQEIFYVRAFAPPLPPDYPGTHNLNESRTLAPGRYSLTFQASSNPSSNTEFTTQDVRAEFDVEYSITAMGGGGEGDTFFWEAQNGSWDDVDNWEPQGAPGNGDTAIFDRDATFEVTLDSESVDQAVIERGDVTFRGPSLALVSTEIDSPSFIVGRDSSDLAFARFDNVTDVNTVHSSIGHSENTNGTVRVSQETAWNGSGSLIVGRAGFGDLHISDTSSVTASELRIGDLEGSFGTVDVVPTVPAKQADFALSAGSTAIGLSGVGELTVDGANIATGETLIGVNAGSSGTVTMESDESLLAGWTLRGSLIVGNLGTGMMEVQAGNTVSTEPGQLHSVLVADGAGSDGDLRFDNASMLIGGSLCVGQGGIGFFEFEGTSLLGFDAALLQVGPIGADAPDGASGEVAFRSDGQILQTADITVNGPVFVGQSGSGTLRITRGSHMRADEAFVATGDSGAGVVTVFDSRWEVEEELFIGSTVAGSNSPAGVGLLFMVAGDVDVNELSLASGSGIQGTGRIVSPNSDLGGAVSPGVTLSPFKQFSDFELFDNPADIELYGQESTIGTLSFDGNVNIVGATITIETTGPENFDMVEITGNADLTNTTINFNFIEGYLPRTGDELEFLTATNLTIDENTTTNYTGAAPGFQFDLMNVGNTLMFQAQSNAQPESGEGEGEGEGEGSTEGMGETPGCAAFVGGNTSARHTDALMLSLAVLILGQGRGRLAVKFGNR